MSNPQNAPPQLVLNQCFPDMGMLGEACGFDLEFRQLEAGKLRARCLLLAGFRNLAMRVEFDRKFHQRGCPPQGILTLGFPDLQSGCLRWNGREAKPGALVNFNDGRFNGVNPGNFGGYTLSFSEDLLQEVAERLGIKLNLASAMHTNAFWNPMGEDHNVLRRNLYLLEDAAVNGEESDLCAIADGEQANTPFQPCSNQPI